MKRTYRLLKFKAKLIAYVLLVGVLLYVVAGRSVLSLVSQYRVPLQDYLSSQLEIPVEIAQLEVKWSGFDPILEVRGISVNGASNAHIKTAQVKFAFLDSILNQFPKIFSIRLDTANLKLDQDESGAWFLAGKDLSALRVAGDGGGELDVSKILDGANLKLVDAFIRTSSPKRSEKVWRLPSASLSYVGGRIFAQGNVIRPDGLQPLARFIYSSAEFGSAERLEGELFIEARSSGFFDEHIDAYQWHGISIQELDASGRAWIDLSGITVDSVYAELQISELNWRIEEKSLAPIIQSTLNVAWRGNEHGQRLDLFNLKYNWKGDSCSIPGASYELLADRELIAIESLDLACAADILTSLDIVEGDLAQRIEAGEPMGALNNLWITSYLEDSKKFSVEAELREVALKGYEGAPSVSGVNGYLYTDATSGFVDFKSNDMLLFFPELYLKSWRSQDAQGRVAWWQDGEDFLVESDGIYLKLYESSEVFGDFTLRLNDDDDEDYLGLMLGMRNITLPDVAEFVPFYVVDRDLYQWLSDSLVSGFVEEGMYFAYGSIESDSPENSFTSSLNLQTKDGVLKFSPDWPELSDLALDLSLHGDRLEISGQDAQIKGSKVQSLTVNMPVGSQSDIPKLGVSASIQFENDQYDYWLSESPISEETKTVSDLLSFSGAAKGDLELELALGEEIDARFSLSMDLQGLSAHHTESHLSASDIQGRLDIDSESGVSAQKIKMNILDEPSLLSIEPNPQSDTTAVLLAGKLNIEKLIPEGEGWRFGLSGTTGFDARLDIPNDPEFGTHLRINTDLHGLSSNWPAPLNKLAGTKNAAELLATIKPNQTDLLIQLNGAALPKTKAELLFIDEVFEYGKVLMTTGNKPLSANKYSFSSDGLGISLLTDKANVDAWLDYLSEEIPSAGGDDAGVPEWLKEVSVSATEITVLDNVVRDVNALIHPDSSKIDIELSGQNAQGTIVIAESNRPISIDMKRLKIEETETPEGEAVYPSSVQASIDPREIKAMVVSVDELFIGDRAWGRWGFWTETDETSLIFRDLKGSVGGSEIEGQLSWRYDDGQSYTILTLDSAGADVSPVLAMFGQESPITSRSYSAELALFWSDAPYNFSLAGLSGSADMEFGRGVIKSDSEGAGVLRLFGIFNLDALARRLRLDFSDIYESGISYDTIDMNAVISQGSLRFVDPLVLKGPSSNYELTGGVDLGAQTLDLKMRVQLPISSNVPIAALMLGSPTIGGAVWLVDKILGEPLSQLTTIGYSLTGSWDDPLMKLQ